jgi:hypothetical protein
LFTSKAVHLENAEVYLLDGTFMGDIDNLRKFSREKFKTPGKGRKIRQHRRRHPRP